MVMKQYGSFCPYFPRLLTFLSYFPPSSLCTAFLEHSASSFSPLICSLTIQSVSYFISTTIIFISKSTYWFFFIVTCSHFIIACSFMMSMPFYICIRILNMLLFMISLLGCKSFAVVLVLFISVLFMVLGLVLGSTRRGSCQTAQLGSVHKGLVDFHWLQCQIGDFWASHWAVSCLWPKLILSLFHSWAITSFIPPTLQEWNKGHRGVNQPCCFCRGIPVNPLSLAPGPS